MLLKQKVGTSDNGEDIIFSVTFSVECYRYEKLIIETVTVLPYGETGKGYGSKVI